ncbi:SMI1/KNR4 family protein [Variovorax sp. 160MFSha2.1]|uniref:SMI1/KNR4 family protein n=1 Tax=Variovorax sp. 160MFSha2.1 TaxID=3158367 RepID=UPI003AAB5F9D
MDEETSIAGISDAEIEELAIAQGQVALPAVYREFLKECGRGAGLYQRDASFFFPEIKALKKQLVEMLADEEIKFPIPAEAFVFGAHQGFQFHYFLCNEISDPAVYQIDDGGSDPFIICESFSEYIHRGIQQYRDAFHQKK